MMPAWELKKHLEDRDASIVILGNEVSRLSAEVERLTAALEEIVTPGGADDFWECVGIARAALKEPRT
jgi:hypothetical protein